MHVDVIRHSQTMATQPKRPTPAGRSSLIDLLKSQRGGQEDDVRVLGIFQCVVLDLIEDMGASVSASALSLRLIEELGVYVNATQVHGALQRMRKRRVIRNVGGKPGAVELTPMGRVLREASIAFHLAMAKTSKA